MSSKDLRLLDSIDHDRGSVGLHYVYPVVSRRAGGISIGINLNPNNACNWHCVYCQVPDLKRGAAPEIDTPLLRRELAGFLDEIINGCFMQERVPEGVRRIADVAFSGNGEPTSAAGFDEIVEIVAGVLGEFGLAGKLPVRLITNGSMVHRAPVQEGLRRLAAINGEVWFKVDRATADGMARVNGVRLNPQGVLRRLSQCAMLAPTWVQTCWFAMDGRAPGEDELEAYLEILERVSGSIRGVHLYGLARPSMQPEAGRLSVLPAEEMERVASLIRSRLDTNEKGLEVRVSL